MASVKGFAGDDIMLTRLYAEDYRYELDSDNFVLHYEVVENILIISINPGLLLTDLGASDAKFTAREGARAFMQVVHDANSSGIYHAFGDEDLY